MPLKLFNFSSSKILVIGDVMLDEYWHGEATRISPEAPVPIVLAENNDYRAGGAANVALNIAAFGCQVDLLGIIGDDQAGKTLNFLLNQQTKINNLVVTTKNQPTISKLRIISNDQQLFRIDREQYYSPANFSNLADVFAKITKNNSYSAIVLSDYNKGSLQDPQVFIEYANQHNIPIVIDPKNSNHSVYKGATVLTPNFKEFKATVNIESNGHEPSEQNILEKGLNLIAQLNLQALIITRGKTGLTLITKDHQHQHFSASYHEVFDVTGAGDTVTASIAACVGSNSKKLNLAAYIATIAAGISVSKLGTSCITIEELEKELELHPPGSEANLTIQDKSIISSSLKLGIIDKDELSIVIKQRQSLGETIVLINGCFDIIHSGHINYIEKAKSFGTRLVIAVNDDHSIKTLKGNNRPINTLEHRMQVLAAIRAVDWVVPFNHIRPGNLIEAINPDVLVKTKETFKTVEEIPEYEGAHHVLRNGGKVYLLDRPLVASNNISSTQIINSIQNNNAKESKVYE